ncbi:hypothetical protein [Tabrizicola sp. M-4]|uniref:hypothetical protein n=1 Tax=Tabrizicola sp. M-4 TaxID=3055847 RepID=UPI003DA90BF8
MDENLSFVFNSLQKRLFFVQLEESGGKQGKIRGAKNFPAELSTKSVDSFALALGPWPLQPRRGIDEFQIRCKPGGGRHAGRGGKG